VPTFVLTDADPHGLHIALTYAAALPVASFRFIGVRPSDWAPGRALAGLSATALIPLTEKERVLATNAITGHTYGGGRGAEVDVVMREMQVILESGLKFEIESLITIGAGEEQVGNVGGLAMNGLFNYLERRIASLMGTMSVSPRLPIADI
jgi:DNA topoisomerase VI subunit A